MLFSTQRLFGYKIVARSTRCAGRRGRGLRLRYSAATSPGTAESNSERDHVSGRSYIVIPKAWLKTHPADTKEEENDGSNLPLCATKPCWCIPAQTVTCHCSICIAYMYIYIFISRCHVVPRCNKCDIAPFTYIFPPLGMHLVDFMLYCIFNVSDYNTM